MRVQVVAVELKHTAGVDIQYGYSPNNSVALDGLPVLVARAGYSGELGYEIYTEPRSAGRLWDMLIALGRAEFQRRRDAGLQTLLMGFEVEDHGVQAAPGMRPYRGAHSGCASTVHPRSIRTPR